MYTCCLCSATEIASSCHGNEGCASTIFRSGKSTATSSTCIGFEYLRRMPPPPGEPRADSRVAGVEERRQPRLLDHLVERVERAVVREEGLDVGVELEPAHAVVADQASGLVDGVRPVRVDARERDEDVCVRRRDLGDLLVPDRGTPGDGLGVDGEHDGRHVALAVVGGDVLDRRRAALAEVLLSRPRATRGGARPRPCVRPRRACGRRSPRLARGRSSAQLDPSVLEDRRAIAVRRLEAVAPVERSRRAS